MNKSNAQELGASACSITINNNIVVLQLFATYHVQFLLLMIVGWPDIVRYGIK